MQRGLEIAVLGAPLANDQIVYLELPQVDCLESIPAFKDLLRFVSCSFRNGLRKALDLLFVNVDDPVFFDAGDGVAELLGAPVAGEGTVGFFYHQQLVFGVSVMILRFEFTLCDK